jgi:hypothetical protein
VALTESTQPRKSNPSLADEFGGGRLLVSDARLAFLFANQARHRALVRLFGVSPDQATLLTLVIVTMLGGTAHRKVQRLVRTPSLPSQSDGLLAGASARELLWSLAGSPSREMPFSGALLAIAIVGGTTGPSVVRTLRGFRASSRRMNADFHHRYGYIVDVEHWRERRAERENGRLTAPE